MQERAIRSRQNILDAARDVFSAQGFHGAKVDVIAEKSGVNKQRIYAYFANKAGLFSAVLAESFRTLLAEEQRLLLLTEQDLPSLASEILSCYLEIHEKHPEIWRLLAWENLDGGHHSGALVGLQEPVYAHLRRLYEAGQKGGRFSADIPFEAFVFNLLAVAYFMASNRQTLIKSLGLDLSTQRKRNELCDAILRQGHGQGATIRDPVQSP